MKKLLLVITLIVTTTLITRAQAINPTNFLKLFSYANSEDPMGKIHTGLISLSENWRLIGHDTEEGRLTVTWHYKFPNEQNPSAEFYMTSVVIQGKIRHKITYNFLSQDIFQRYITAVSGLDQIKVTHSNIEDDGSSLMIYETPTNAFTFKINPIELQVLGKTVTRSYGVELYYLK